MHFLGTIFVVIRHHEKNAHSVADAFPVLVGDALGTLDLLTRRQQFGSVQVGPGVVLRVGQFQVVRVQRDRHLDDLADVVDVEPVDDAVEDHGPAMALDHARHFLLEIECPRVRKEIVQFARGILERQLDVVEPAALEFRNAPFVQADAGGEQIGVEAQPMGFRNQNLQVVPCHRLAAGKAALDAAGRTRFPQHPEPVVGAQLILMLREIHRGYSRTRNAGDSGRSTPQAARTAVRCPRLTPRPRHRTLSIRKQG
jgi:hypothetical protein